MVIYIVNFTIYFSVIIALIYFIRFAKKSKAYKVFAIYLILISIIQLALEYLIKFGTDHTIFLFHYYFILQFILLSFFYYYLLKQKYILWVLFVVSVFIGYQYIEDPEIYNKYNIISVVITQTLLVVYSIMHLYNSLNKKSKFVLVSIGAFIYLLSSTLIFASGNLIFDLSIPEYVSRLLNDFNAVLYLLFQILIFIEWYRNFRVKN